MQLSINDSQRELKAHGSFEFPVFISQEILSRYERGSFSWHWHPEIELTLVVEGQIAYQVNGTVYRLHAGEGLFCNSNALHTGHMIDGEDCYYISTTFHPKIIYGFEGSALQQSYVAPLLADPAMGSLAFSPDIPWHRLILEAMEQIYLLSLEPPAAFELRVQQLLSSIWLALFSHLESGTAANPGVSSGRDVERLRTLLTFIQEHYMEHLTLELLAEQINICRSECCRFFKKHMHVSLFDYLLSLRIEKSLPLLTEGTCSVTEIAGLTGFSSSAYFTRVFRQQMNCTPSEYRKRQLQKQQLELGPKNEV